MMYNVGDIVKYNVNWCTEEEQKYMFVVLEVGLLDAQGEPNRLKMGCLNSNISFGYVEVVEEEMVDLVQSGGDAN